MGSLPQTLSHCFALCAEKGEKVTVVQIAPAVRVAVAETLGLAPGDVSTGQLVAGLRKLGFTYVFGKSAAS